MTEHHKSIRNAGLRAGLNMLETVQAERPARQSSQRLIELRELLRNRRSLIDKDLEESA